MCEKLPLVKLRAIEPEDLDILYGIENDMSLWNDSITSVPYSRYMLYDYIANTRNDIYTDRQVRMMIENNKCEVVGIVDLINFDPKHLRAEIGIVIKRDFRNLGYAQSAINKIKDFFKDLKNFFSIFVLTGRNHCKASINTKTSQNSNPPINLETISPMLK